MNIDIYTFSLSHSDMIKCMESGFNPDDIDFGFNPDDIDWGFNPDDIESLFELDLVG